MQENFTVQHCKRTVLLYYRQGRGWVEHESMQSMEDFDENVDVQGVIDWFVWLIVMSKWDVVEKLVESMEDQIVLQHEGEQPCDHKMGHSILVDEVGRSYIDGTIDSMVQEYSMIDYENKEMESFEPYKQAMVTMVVAMSLLQLLDLFDVLLSSLVRR